MCHLVILYCTEQTGTSPAQTAQPNAITIPVQEQEHGNTTEQLSGKSFTH